MDVLRDPGEWDRGGHSCFRFVWCAFLFRATPRRSPSETLFVSKPDQKPELAAVCDLPGPALLAASADAQLLVVGARGHGRIKGALLGSVSQHCVRHAGHPVAVVRRDARDAAPTGRIVVGVDGSESAVRALCWASAEARRREARLVVVHGWQAPLAGLRTPLSGAFDTAKLWHGAEQIVDQALADAGLVNDGTIERRVVQALPADALFEAAATADLVVVGTRGPGGFAGRRLGSVSHHVVTHANATVVVVPPDASPCPT